MSGSAGARGVAIQSDGKIVVAGRSGSGINFGILRLLPNGSLDTTFGSSGKKEVSLSGSAGADAVTIQPDGKILVAGGSSSGNAFGVIRLTTSGVLDNTFGGGDGKVEVTLSGSATAYDIALDQNSKIVVAGSSNSGNSFGIIRLETNGALDSNFGTSGKKEVPLSGSAGGYGLAIQQDNKIVVVGESSSGNAFGVIRLLATGVLDSTFSLDGKLEIPLSGSAGARDVVIQNDGKIVIVGGSNSGINFAAVRLTSTGAIDTVFGVNGIRSFGISGSSAAEAVTLQSDGKIILAGTSAGAFAVERLTAAGDSDPGWPSANSHPRISSISPRSINEDTSSPAVPFAIGDDESAESSLTLAAQTSDSTLLPLSGLSFGGASGSRTLTITPAANRTGTATITIRVSDGVLTATSAFAVTVLDINDAPVISSIANQSTNEDDPLTGLTFTISDLESAPNLLTITATSSNPALLPVGGISFSGTGTTRSASLTPASNQSGTTNVTLTVSDGTLTSSEAFTLTVNPVNDPPAISGVSSQTILENRATPALNFTLSDLESSATSLSVTRTTSNAALIPVTGISVGGSGTNRNVTITPLPNKGGEATVTLTVSDGALSSSTSFLVRVLGLHYPGQLYWIGGSGNWSTSAIQWSAAPEGPATLPWGDGNHANFSSIPVASIQIPSGIQTGDLVFNSSSPSFTGGGSVTFAYPGLEVNVSPSTATVSWAPPLAGANGFAKTGPGTLTLKSAGSYQGITNLTSGRIIIEHGAAPGAGGFDGNTLTNVAVGAALEIRGPINLNEHLHLNGNGPSAQGALRSLSGDSTCSAAWALDGNTTIGVEGGTLTMTNIIYHDTGTRSLTKTGGGRLILSGNNSYTGITRINSGTLRSRHASSLGAGGFDAATLTNINPGAALELEGSIRLDEHIHLSGSGLANTGVIRSLSGQNILAAPLALDGDSTIAVDGGSLDIQGTFYHDVGVLADLTKTGPGLILLRDNTGHDGITSVRQGTARLLHNGALGKGGFDALTLTNVYAGAAVELAGNIAVDEHFHAAGTGPDGQGALRNLSGNNILNNHVGLDGDLSIFGEAGTLTLNGLIYQDTGLCGLRKNGPGRVILNGANTYNGQTIITAGILQAGHPGALGLGGFTTETQTKVYPGSAIEFISTLACPEHFHLGGNGPDNLGALRVTQGTVTLSQPIALDAPTSVNVAAGAALILTSQFYSELANGAGLTKLGTGSLFISGAASFAGPAVVREGLLRLGTASLLDSAEVILEDTARLQLDFTGDDSIKALRTGGVWLPAGRYNSANLPGFLSGPGTLVVLSGGSPFNNWMATFPSTNQILPLDDPDRDGVPNLVEFALNGHPTSNLNRGTQYLQSSTPGLEKLLFTIPVRTGAIFALTDGKYSATVDGIRYEIQSATTLQNFSAEVVEVSTPPEVATRLPTLQGTPYTYRTFRSTRPGSPAAEFLRVKISLQ